MTLNHSVSRNPFSSLVGLLFVVLIGSFLVGCVTVRMMMPDGMMPVLDTKGCTYTVFKGDALWTVVPEEKVLPPRGSYALRVDPKTSRVAARVYIPEQILTSFDVGEGALWVAAGDYAPEIYKLDPDTGRVVASVRVGPINIFGSPIRLAVGAGAVWAVRGGDLFRMDPQSNEVISIPLSRYVLDVTIVENTVWVHLFDQSSISRIDARTGQLAATIVAPPDDLGITSREFFGSFSTAERPAWSRWMAAGADGMWVLLHFGKRLPQYVGRVDLQLNRIVATNQGQFEAIITDIAASEAAIWVSVFNKGWFSGTTHYSIVELDPKTTFVKRKIPYASVSSIYSAMPTMAVGAGTMWVCLPDSGLYRVPLSAGKETETHF